MTARLALWILWTALSLCLPGATRLELCLCDGLAGLLDGAACARSQAADAPSCCGAEERAGEPEFEPRAPDGGGCACLQLEVGRGEPAVLPVSVPATALFCAPAPELRVAAPASAPLRATRGPRARVRTRSPVDLPLRP